MSMELLQAAPRVLQRLPMTRSGVLPDGYPYRRYMGLDDGARWDITLRTDLMLCIRIEREKAGEIEKVVQVQQQPARVFVQA